VHVWLKLAGMTAERWQRREARRLYSPRPDGPNHNANKEPTSHLADALAGSRHRPCDKRHNKHREGTGREKEKLKSALENGTEAGTTETGLDWTAAVERNNAPPASHGIEAVRSQPTADYWGGEPPKSPETDRSS